MTALRFAACCAVPDACNPAKWVTNFKLYLDRDFLQMIKPGWNQKQEQTVVCSNPPSPTEF